MLKEFIENKEEAKKALMGTILADGSIQKARTKSYINKTYVEITHTSKNLDYLKAKKEVFEMLDDTTCSIKEHNKVTKEKTYSLFRLTTSSNSYFKEVRDILYDNNRIKKFPKEVIDNFNDLSLLFLYLDDGTLKVKYYEGTSKIREVRITFCLDSFTYEELKYFQEYLLNKYNIKTGIYRHTKNLPLNRGFRIWMNTENTKKYMEIINKFYNCIPSMQYKFLQYYSL
jgi:hypothetical protein